MLTISNERLDELLKGCKQPEDLLGDGGFMKDQKIRLMERMLGAGLTAHPVDEAGGEPPPGQTNRRKGMATKRVKGSDGEGALSVPRDREGSFEPVPVKKGQTRIDGGDDKSEPAGRHRFETAGEGPFTSPWASPGKGNARVWGSGSPIVGEIRI